MWLCPTGRGARDGNGDRVESSFWQDRCFNQHVRVVEAGNRGDRMRHGRIRIEAENKRVIAIAANDRVDAADAVVSTLRDGVITVSEVEGAYAPPRPGGDRDVVIARTRRDIAVAGDSAVGGERAGIEAGTDADTATPDREIAKQTCREKEGK